MKAHQRSCKTTCTIDAVVGEEGEDGNASVGGDVDNMAGDANARGRGGGDFMEGTGNIDADSMFKALLGLKLPKSEAGWKEANLYFQINLD